MPSAREIRKKLREKQEAARRKQEDATITVSDLGNAAIKIREDHEATLRAKFEAALKARGADRAANLRAEFEAALADAPQVVAAELAAGRAVNAAGTLKVPLTELAEVTELPIELLRSWGQATKPAPTTVPPGPGDSRQAGEPARPRAERPATGLAVVIPPDSDGARERGQTDDGSGVDGTAG
ncbi:MAG TPA: hypothetical protein VGN81_06390 [Pseudonocardiaceae bacterium]